MVRRRRRDIARRKLRARQGSLPQRRFRRPRIPPAIEEAMSGLYPLGPSQMAVKLSDDWCHVCGDRIKGHIEIWFPENAEHEKKKDKPRTSNYIRICKECVWEMARCTSAMDSRP